jgi:hypothetical protein
MKRGWVIGISFLWLGCSTASPDLIVQQKFFKTEGKRILIQHFDLNPTAATQVHKPSVAHFGETLALDIQQYLRLAHFQKTLVIGPAEPARGDILIQGAITGLAGGNQTYRILLNLFGFGGTHVAVKGEAIDLTDSQTVLAFSFSRRSPYTWKSNEEAVRENLREIAQEIARALIESSP